MAEKGEKIDIEKLEVTEGGTVKFEDVLLTTDGKTTTIGKPYIEGAVVTGKVVKQFKDDKVMTFKMSQKNRYKKTIGHRQSLTKIEITDIKA